MFSLQSIFGRTDNVFRLLQASSEAAHEAARTASHLVRSSDADTGQYLAGCGAARRLEKELAAELSEELVGSRITDLDREDLEAMNSGLYRIPKTVEKFAARYALVSGRLDGIDFGPRTDLLAACTEVLAEMVLELRHGMRIAPMRKLQTRLQGLEGDADRLLLEPWDGLYRQTNDPIHTMLAKDLFEIIERAIDACRDVGNVIYATVLKNS